MKKKIVIMLSVMALMTSGCGKESEAETEEITVEENQELKYAMVTQIDGNEITYTEIDEAMVQQVEASDTDTKQEEKQQSSEGEDGQQMEKPSGERPQMPEGEDGEMPQMPEGEDGEMPQMPEGEDGEIPQMLEGEDGEDGQQMEEASGEKADKRGGFSGETVTVQIPVGVTVHTSMGTDTTFSRIEAGDMLKILFEEDEDGNMTIVEIWMM